ncbi:unnamed protein product [Ascophyllum nodosum]
MLRFRSLAVACVRDTLRPNNAGRGTILGVAARPLICHFNESSPVLTAPQGAPLPASPPLVHINGHSSETARSGAVSHEQNQCVQKKEADGHDGLDIRNVERQQSANTEEVKEGGLPTRDVERSRLHADLLWKIKVLRKEDPAATADRAIDILEEGRVEGVSSLEMYRAVFIHLLSVSRNLQDAPKKMEAAVGLMKLDGLQPDISTYNKIIDFHAQVHDSKRAQETYEEMLSAGVTPDQKTLSHMIMAHSWGNSNAMYTAVEELRAKGWRASRGAYQGMIAVMGRHEDWHGVLDTIRRMREERKRPTEAAFVMAFKAAGRLHLPEACRELFQHRADLGLPPQEYAYVRMMATLMRDNPEESLEYWRQLVCVNGVNGLKISSHTFNLAMKATTKMDNLEEAEAILEMMQDQEIAITDETYLSALGCLGDLKGAERARALESVERAFELIARKGPSPGPRVLVRVGVSYAQADMWDKALSVFEAILSRRLQLSGKTHLSSLGWECMMRSQLSLGRPAAVKETWALSIDPSMTSREVKHTRRALQEAVAAAEQLEDAEWAMEVRDHAIKSNNGSAHVDELVVRVLAGADKVREARDILEPWGVASLKDVTATSRVFEGAYQQLLASCQRSNDTSMALQLVQEMISFKPPYSPGLSSLPFVLEALTMHGRFEDVVPLFEDVVSYEDQDEPDALCYVLVLDAAFKAGDRVNTVKYLEEARKRGLSPSAGALAFAEDAGGGVPDVDGDVNGEIEGSTELPSQSSGDEVVEDALYLKTSALSAEDNRPVM